MRVREIQPRETLPLRQLVLRPHQRPEELSFAGDADPETRHFGAFEGRRLVAIASIYRQDHKGRANTWQLRGMAALPEARGRGFGAAALAACLDYARACNGALVWCNAREKAAGFYLKHGFKTVSGVFEIEGVGPHYRMEHPLATAAVF